MKSGYLLMAGEIEKVPGAARGFIKSVLKMLSLNTYFTGICLVNWFFQDFPSIQHISQNDGITKVWTQYKNTLLPLHSSLRKVVDHLDF